jgi:uncharacterized membrane protein
MKKVRKSMSQAWQKEYYPAPEPLPRTRSFWIALALVALAALIYIIYFSIFLTTKQDAFKTNGEDLGIMDQAIWSLLHGSMFHQTICNVLTDTNCYGINGIYRFAIHFEPILFPISLLYLIWPDPKTLLILQVLVVASGAFPAFWLARLRLRNAWAAVPFALLYLLYPPQQYSVNFDFHAETLTTALLLFALYFLYTRKTLLFFVFIVLCLACKEEIAGVVVMLGLWALLLQRRRRVGLGLIALALCWTVVELTVFHFSSPTGQPLLTSRYSYLGNSPVQVALNILTHPLSLIRDHVLETNHILYLRKLLAPLGYLPLFAPWVLVLAAPTLALNLLSSTPNMYSGEFQYNAEIVPILIFASIEATVLIIWIARWFAVSLSVEPESLKLAPSLHSGQALNEANGTETMAPAREARPLPARTPPTPGPIPPAPSPAREAQPLPARSHALPLVYLLQVSILVLIPCFMLLRVYNSTTQYDVYGAMPYTPGFIWPHVSAHNKLASHFLDEIPANATVSTQTSLVPHLSQRQSIYLFPYADDHADYILLDATGYTYPFKNYDDFAATVKTILRKGDYGVIDMRDGYILLKRGYPPLNITPALQMIDDDDHAN